MSANKLAQIWLLLMVTGTMAQLTFEYAKDNAFEPTVISQEYYVPKLSTDNGHSLSKPSEPTKLTRQVIYQYQETPLVPAAAQSASRGAHSTTFSTYGTGSSLITPQETTITPVSHSTYIHHSPFYPTNNANYLRYLYLNGKLHNGNAYHQFPQRPYYYTQPVETQRFNQQQPFRPLSYYQKPLINAQYNQPYRQQAITVRPDQKDQDDEEEEDGRREDYNEKDDDKDEESEDVKENEDDDEDEESGAYEEEEEEREPPMRYSKYSSYSYTDDGDDDDRSDYKNRNNNYRGNNEDDEDDSDERPSNKYINKQNRSRGTANPKKIEAQTKNNRPYKGQYQRYTFSKGANGKPKIETIHGKYSQKVPVAYHKVYKKQKWYLS